MANISLELNREYKNLYIKSDSATMNTEYPVLQIYINDELKYTLAVGGSATIGGVVYTTTSGATDLNYVSTTTTVGTEYIHEITTETLGLTGSDLEALPSGVYRLVFLDVTQVTNLFEGIVPSYEIECCMAKKVNNALSSDSPCKEADVMPLVRSINAVLAASKASALQKEFTNAQCSYDIAKTYCEDDCGCGCS
jgi:hypothetical protein